MAVQKGKPAPVEESLVVGMNEEEFVAGGLATDFDGEVTEARTVIWNYDNGNGPKMAKIYDADGNEIGEEAVLTLAVRVAIERADGEAAVVNFWSAGDPTNFAPSMDGKTPSPVDETGCSEGIYFIKVGSKSGLNNNTNYAQALQALADAESQAPHLKRARTPDIRFLEGLFGHWERIPQKKRAGVVKPEAEGKARFGAPEVLVCTQVKAKPATAPAAKAGPKAVPTKAAPATPAAKTGAPATVTPAASSANTSDLNDKLMAIVMQAALDAGEDGVAKGKLAAIVLKDPGLTQQERAKGVPIIGSTAFLDAGFAAQKWIFDADNGLVNSWPEEE